MPQSPKHHKSKSYGRKPAPKWNQSQARKIRRTNNWKRTSELIRIQNPLCADPFGDHGERPVPSEQVHHIKPIEQSPELAFSRSNLMALCAACHEKMEQMGSSGPESIDWRKFQSLHHKLGDFLIRKHQVPPPLKG